ncbi:MAG: copper amine oxidase N-terminal domain-containing protein [Deltaproteobacteria bacterium]
MKKLSIIIITLIFSLLTVVPVLGAVNIEVNDQTYQSIDKPQIFNGCTMVTLDMVEKMLGVDVHVSGNSIKIINNTDKLEMALDSKYAKINGKAIVLSESPKILNTHVMVPARGVFEALGARVGWQAEHQTLTVLYDEQKQDMSAEQILDKMSIALEKCKSYKLKAEVDDKSSSEYPDIPGSKKTYDTHSDMEMASQAKPFLVVCKIIEHRTDIEDRLGFESQVVGNEKGSFLKMGNDPWQRMIEPDIRIDSLIYAAGSEDPISCLQHLRTAGAVLSMGNDIEENGNNCWVIHVTMSAEALPKVMYGAMRGCPLAISQGDPTGSYDRVLKNTQAELSYTVKVDQETFLPVSIRFDSMRIFRNYNTIYEAGREGVSALSVSTFQNSGSCQIYGFGESFKVPDVSTAIPGYLPEG